MIYNCHVCGEDGFVKLNPVTKTKNKTLKPEINNSIYREQGRYCCSHSYKDIHIVSNFIELVETSYCILSPTRGCIIGPMRLSLYAILRFNPPVTAHKKPEIKCFGVFFVVNLNKLLTNSRLAVIREAMTPMWHHCGLIVNSLFFFQTCR